MSVPRRIVLTGGPGAGKTTLLEELARRGFRTVPEAARAILSTPSGIELRASDPDGFATAILKHEIARFEVAEAAPDECVFFDRGLGDLAAMPVQSKELRRRIDEALRKLRYEPLVIRAPAWRAIYRNDDQRIQTWPEARGSDRAVSDAWRDAGYALVDLPKTSPDERADFVMELL